MIDIVLPKNNEKEFIEIAERLGYSELCFLYSETGIPEKMPASKLKIYLGVYADPKKLEKNAFKLKRKGTFTVTYSSDVDRTIIEKGNADVMVDFELIKRRDFIHHRASGLNQVLTKTMASNNIAYGISLSTLLSAKNKDQILGRIMQNISLCRKHGIQMITASFASSPYQMKGPSDLQKFLEVIGMQRHEAKAAVSFSQFIKKKSITSN